jgi:hypothetical protein
MHAPPVEVMKAFGAGDEPVRLPGGQGSSWVSGGLVLKPDTDPAFQQWYGEVLGSIRQDGFRLAEAVPTPDGDWTRAGWSATVKLDGAEPDYQKSGTWARTIEAGRAFHRATVSLENPMATVKQDNWWSRADEHAWDRQRPPVSPKLESVVSRLSAACTGLETEQVVHGDLTMNILFKSGEAPAILDVSPYWRAPSYAEGIVLADAVCWHGADASLPDDLGVPIAAVSRALLFRVLTSQERINDGVGLDFFEEEVARYENAVSALGL